MTQHCPKIGGKEIIYDQSHKCPHFLPNIEHLLPDCLEGEESVVEPQDIRCYGDLEKERREFWARTFNAALGRVPLHARAGFADTALAEFDKRFNK